MILTNILTNNNLSKIPFTKRD